MKRTTRLLLVLTLNIVWGSCWVSSANASVITTGTWMAMSPDAFWNNPSWDGPLANAGDMITRWGWPVEYLSAAGGPAAFAFDQTESFAEVVSVTTWLDNRGLWQMPDGSFTFTTHGYTYNTLTTPQQFALFRYTESTRNVYFLAVEDIPSPMRSDRDYNDFIAFAIETVPPPPPPTKTPEPGTLALLLSGGAVLWRKVRS